MPDDIESAGYYEAKESFHASDGKQTTGIATIWQHKASEQHVLERLRTHPAHGLSIVDAEKRLATLGPNVLSPPLQKPWWRKLLYHFTDFFSLMLQFAAILCFLSYLTEPTEIMHLYLGIFLYIVVIATSLFSFAQQNKSDKTLREFRNFLPPKATVLRDGGGTFVIDASTLVVGDIVVIKMGDKIPADIRILQSNKFSVDNSSLTGESEPVERNSQHTSDNPLETANLAFSGCLAVDGSCVGVVISTGDRTVFGEIARLTSSTEEEQGQTTLQNDIHHFVINISIFAVTVGIVFFIIGSVNGTQFIHNLVYSIGIIVSNIPEGLLATVTVSLTASARRMSRKNVLVKQLDAVETLGSTTVICSDKTGTLTQNKMNVSHLAYGGRVEVIQPGWNPSRAQNGGAERANNQGVDVLNTLIYGASVCSTAVFDQADRLRYPQKSISERVICGDASEAGILRFTEHIHNVQAFRDVHSLIATVPFNSRNKFMATVHKCPDSNLLLRIIVKGAPERIMERCTEIFSQDGFREITPHDRVLLERQISYLTGRGERVLAYAERYLSPGQASLVLNTQDGHSSADNIPISDLCFIGLISLIDPPRTSVSNAVQICKNAGIRVIMVTGDHHETARSIAKQVGIISKPVVGEDESCSDFGKECAVVVKGQDVEDFDDRMWDDVLSHSEIVFARTSPHHKLTIVQQLQRRSEVVTVTGDGCNDAPALRQANTGVAMGISGSEVSREAANIVLLDDNFTSIVKGVEEGRLIFDNLKKSIAYTLTSNVPQLIPFLVFITLQVPLPLTTILVLSIDLGTDIFPAIALAYEAPESDIMIRPPRDALKDNLMNPRLVSYSTLQLGIIQTFGGFFAYLIVMLDYGLAPQVIPFLNKGGHFASERVVDQRWMYTIQEKQKGVGYEAGWFLSANAKFSAYFQKATPGFVQQTVERFDLLPAGQTASRKNATDGTVSQPEQFRNMIKILGREIGRPPCLAFSCNLNANSSVVSRNNIGCFDPTLNRGPVQLGGKAPLVENNNIVPGREHGQGCFELWTPKREREVLRRAQTAFFAAIVVAQIFTLFACKTRILSLFQRGIRNFALLFSLFLEMLVGYVLVYLPVLANGFGLRPLKLVHWLPGVPFGMLILAYDETRKWFIRRHMTNESGDVLPQQGLLDRMAKWVHDFTLW